MKTNKTFNKNLLTLSLISFLSFNAASSELNIDLNQSDEHSLSTIDTSSINPKDQEMIRTILKTGNEKEDLSSDEISNIDRKKHLIYKYLYENQELSKLRTLLKNEIKDRQKHDSKDKAFPYSPTDVVKFRKMQNSIDKATNSPLNGPVHFKISTINIDVDAPKPIPVRVATGYSSSIMFFDEEGKPWPILGDIIGDKKSFASYPVPGKTHIGVFEIKKNFTESNALINLKGLDVPVVIRLIGSENTVDARVSIRIPKEGPNASTNGTYVSPTIDNANPTMLTVLNGDKLHDSKSYNLNGVQGTVWLKNNWLYIRTRSRLLSPPYHGQISSPSGYHVYEVSPTTNLLFSVDGKMTDATIEKQFNVDIKQENSLFAN